MGKWLFGMVLILSSMIAGANYGDVAQHQGVATAVSTDWGVSVGDLQFRAVPVKPNFATDEPVLVNLEIKTNGNHPVSFATNNPPLKAFKIMLTDSQGQAVPLTRYGKLVQATPSFGPHDSYANPVVQVSPGAILEYHFWINRMYDMSLPGNYHIIFSRAGLAVGNRELPDVVSNTAVIKVVESTNFSTPETNLDIPS